MTEKEYRSHPAISRSDLWKIRESPEKFRYYMDNPQEPTPALLFGQVVHKLLLQPSTFSNDFIVMFPGVDRRTKAGKEVYAEFLELAGERTIVPSEVYQTAEKMVTKAIDEPFVSKLLSGVHEKEYFWTDEMTGEDCKCRVDAEVVVGSNLYVIDYKSANDASTDAFMRDAIKYGYHFQAAMYSDGVEHNTGVKPIFVFIVQEKNPPYSVNILQADEAFVLNGYDVFRELIGTYHYCKETGNWFGYMGREGIINTLNLPAWMKGERE